MAYRSVAEAEGRTQKSVKQRIVSQRRLDLPSRRRLSDLVAGALSFEPAVYALQTPPAQLSAPEKTVSHAVATTGERESD